MRNLVLAVSFAAILSVPALPFASALPGPDPYQAALDRGIAYLATQSSKGGEYMVEAVIGAGIDPGMWPTPQANILDRLVIPAVGTLGNDPIREIHAVAQSGYTPYAFQGRDLVDDIKTAWMGSQQGVGQAAFTLLALHAAGVPKEDATMQDVISLLQQGQFASGGWSCWGLPSPDCTGFALVALASENAFLPGTAERGRLWLDMNRLPNGGYTSGGHLGSLVVAGIDLASASEGANTQSTIWAINGYRAIGDPAPAASMAYLLTRQMPDGGFAWRDVDAKSNLWATTEVIAGWKQAFNQMPTFAPATVTVPTTAAAGVPVTIDVPGFTNVVWQDVSSSVAPLLGAPLQWTFPATGSSVLHVDAQRAGQHHREKVTTAVTNDVPIFVGLPADLSVARRDTLQFTPSVSDTDGQVVSIVWTLGTVSGTGPVVYQADRRGEFVLQLTADDGFGGVTTASIPVQVTR